MELQPSAQSHSQNEDIVNNSKEYPKNQKLNFFRSAVFNMKTGVCLKYFVHNWKTNEEIKTKRNTFSLVADADVEESVLFNAELKLLFY